jgi:hypothetical protein
MISLKNLCFALALLFTSCSGGRYLSFKVKSAEITSLEVFKPISFIALVEKENKGVINDSISYRLEKILSKEIFDSTNMLPTLNPIIIKDEHIETQLEYEIIQICMSSSQNYSLKTITIPSRIDNVLETRGKRFGLIVFCSGFTRSKENLKSLTEGAFFRAAVETVAFGAISGVSSILIDRDMRSKITLHIMIVDAEKNNIAFFNDPSFRALDVLDEKLIKKKIAKAFSTYFKK